MQYKVKYKDSSFCLSTVFYAKLWRNKFKIFLIFDVQEFRCLKKCYVAYNIRNNLLKQFYMQKNSH